MPTDDTQVKLRLRSLDEPITLFGEDNAARRDRLRLLLSLTDTAADRPEERAEAQEEKEYYTDGSNALFRARRDIAIYSLARARRRIALQERQAQTPLLELAERRQALEQRLRKVVAQGSQVASDRACGIGRFSPDGQTIAVGSWSGEVKIFGSEDLQERRRLSDAHTDKVGGLAWHPSATSDSSTESLQLMTSGAEGSVALWSATGDTPITRLQGHGGRVSRIACHPAGKHLASASFDGTWRLWDLATTQELLAQPGHSKEVYSVCFQGDGALLCSVGLDAIGRVWDLRSGRTVMVLEGHAKAIHGCDWRDDGITIATASADDSCKIWDLRQVRCTNTLPAHKSLVSDCRFFRSRGHAGRREGQHNNTMTEGDVVVELDLSHDHDDNDTPDQDHSGSFLCTSGYDGRINVWSCGDWALVHSLIGHAEHKVMSCDVSSDGATICSTGWDRTVRVWSG